jgi:hypothetical protein
MRHTNASLTRAIWSQSERKGLLIHRQQKKSLSLSVVSLESPFGRESESNSEAVFGDSHHSRDSSKSNDQLDRQVPNMPNCKLANAHERNPTVCSNSPQRG